MKKLELKGLAGVLHEAGRQRSKAKTVAALVDNKSIELMTILKGNFDERLRWDIPAGTPPDFLANPIGKLTIAKVQPTIGRYLKGHPMNKWQANTLSLKNGLRERAWINMLENLHEDEANVLIAMVSKSFNNEYGISKQAAEEAFPELFK